MHWNCLKRGHMLVADDVVEVKQRLGGVLYGTGAELIRHHMELRGVGIIDVQKIFGVGSVLDRTRIELVIRLEEWKQTVEYDRVGLSDRTTNVLGVRVPEIVMPVRPGTQSGGSWSKSPRSMSVSNFAESSRPRNSIRN